MIDQAMTYVVPFPPAERLFQSWRKGLLAEDSVVHRFMDSLTRTNQGKVSGNVCLEILLHKNSGKNKKAATFNPNFDAAKNVLLSALELAGIVTADQVQSVTIKKGRQMSGGKASIKIIPG